MLWFWIMAVLRTLVMLGIDAAWMLVSIWLIKRKTWRALACLFLLIQAVALSFLIAGFEWHHYTPKALVVAVVTWHYFGGALLLLLATVYAGVLLRRWWRGRQTPSALANARSQTELSRRDFLGASTAMAPALFNVLLTGAGLAQLNQFRIRRIALSLPTLPRALDGMTIAHLTDLHIGPYTSGRVLEKMVEATNALRADVVVFTGDLIQYELADLSAGIGLIKALESRHGLWMVEGNHDLAEDGNEFERRVKAAGLPLLLDESVMAQVRGCPVQLFGLRWISLGDPDNPGDVDNASVLQLHQLLKKRQPEAFPIVLAHHPHVFDAAAKAGLPLTLAGHTHGGQWMLGGKRGVGSALFRYWSGHYSRGQSQLIVSNGVGNVFPLRINAPAEIVHVVLRCA